MPSSGFALVVLVLMQGGTAPLAGEMALVLEDMRQIQKMVLVWASNLFLYTFVSHAALNFVCFPSSAAVTLLKDP